jgi:HAD superfamily hydrolase (TIGR01662 family)
MKDVNFIITDLDDTIWDWLEMWFMSFSPYLERISLETGIDIDVLKDEFKVLHEKYGTTEMSFIYKELPSIVTDFHPLFDKSTAGHKNILQEYYYNKKNNLKAYHGVIDTLKYIKSKGVKIVAFTESNVFFTKYRTKLLELDGILDAIYSPEGPDVPASVYKHDNEDLWEPTTTMIKTLPRETRKPNAQILDTILKDFNADKEKTVYIGDKLDRDILMAQQAGMTSVHASYGHKIESERYKLLVAVTHWTEEEVIRERNFKNQNEEVKAPDYTIKSFIELETLFNYSEFKS